MSTVAQPTADKRTAERIIWFAVVNVIAVAGMLGIFYLVLDLGSLTPAMERSFAFFNRFKTLMVLAALSPFLASLLIGQHYMRKGRKRRQMMAARQAAEEQARRVARAA
jgi:hypothetical protein